MAMREEYERLIAEHDKTLSLLRKQWMEADNAADKTNYYERINAALAERKRLMNLRDESEIGRAHV